MGYGVVLLRVWFGFDLCISLRARVRRMATDEAILATLCKHTGPIDTVTTSAWHLLMVVHLAVGEARALLA